MTEFKVGDKVIAVGAHHTGKTFTVQGKSSLYIRATNGGNYSALFKPEEIERVKPEPKFKKGDWAKAVGFGTVGGSFEGRAGQVTNVTDMGDQTIITLKYPHEAGKFGDGTFYAKYIQPALEPKAKPKFQEGDVVKPQLFNYSAFVGKTLVVDGYCEEENQPYPVKVRAIGEGYRQGHDFREDELELVQLPVKTDEPAAPTIGLFSVGGWGKVAPKAEAVDGPAHYGGKDNPYEVIKVAEAWGFKENAYLFNALKYLGRAGKKGSKVEDLKKLMFYVEREIALEEAK